MRRVMRAVAAVTFLAGFALAVAAQQPPPAGFVPWANKLLQKDNTPAVIAHDFGTVPHGTVLTHKFAITNIYDAPLQVIDVRKSCSCLEATPPTKVLQPNESADLVVTMNAGKFSGPNAQTFFVTVGPQYTSTAVIRVQANSRADVTLNPGQASFGVVPLGGTPTVDVFVRYTGRQRDWKLVGVAPVSGPFDVKLSDAGRGETKVTVALKADAKPGPIFEQVSLQTSDPAASLLTLNVSATVVAPVTVAPASVAFDGVKVGQERTAKVVVRATRPFRIEPVADPGDGVTIETFPARAPVQIVTVKFAPAAAGAVRKAITFKTDLDGATATLTVEGEGTK